MITPIKLARLLLQLCAKAQHTNSGACIHCPYTHEEIGLYIGVSEETVACLLADLCSLKLVEQSGSTFVVPNLRALEDYTEQSAC